MNRSLSGASSGDAADRPARDAAGQSPQSDGRLFERVLQETESAADSGLPDDADWRVLLDVARRHPGASLTLEPVLVEMVESLLRQRISHGAGAPGDWPVMVRRIAATLYEDQPSHERLENLWDRLSEAAK